MTFTNFYSIFTDLYYFLIILLISTKFTAINLAFYKALRS
jgi:hypothetical protein